MTYCIYMFFFMQQLLDVTGLRHADHSSLYAKLKDELKHSWKARSLWSKLDKRAAHRDYGHGRACIGTSVSLQGWELLSFDTEFNIAKILIW